MNTKGYSHILDVVAGDQVPKDLDLAPNIMIRIQKRKGILMQPRTRFFSAALLVVMVLVVLFYTVPGIAAAVEHWFGYVPGVGFVREGQIRVLEHPVSVTREGINVTVEQVVLDSERTALVYSVDGIPNTAIVTSPKDQHCSYTVSLRLPSSSLLQALPDGIQYWGSGYQHRFYYPPIPAAINDSTLVVTCLFNTRPGSAPESWEIPLHFVPAPPNMTAFPVIEIPTPTASEITATPTNSPVTISTAEASPEPVSMSLTLDRAVQMADGYLIYATLNWKDTPFIYAQVIDVADQLHLLYNSGQAILYELQQDEQTTASASQRKTVFAIKTAPIQTSGPLTLVLDGFLVEIPVEASFTFDPGPSPKPGQTWTLDQDVTAGAYRLNVQSVTAGQNGYTFEISTNGGIVSANLTDLEHPLAMGGGGGGSEQSTSFTSGVNYAGSLPSGPVTITIQSIGVRFAQRLEAQWTPPAASPSLLPTQPAACLTAASWKAALAQKLQLPKPTLPEGLAGRVLTSGLMDAKTGKWRVTISDLDGSNAQVFEGAQDGALSPDGTQLVYSVYGEGISVANLNSGQKAPVPGTANGDFNPIWSPDGKQIVFNRGMGIFDLFMVNPDGSDLRQLTHGGVQEWPAGWLPDGHLLYSVPGRENEYTIYKLDVQSGASEVFSQANLQSITPDSRHIITTEQAFGDRWLTYISEQDGSNRWLLADSSLWVLTPILNPDDTWLLAGVSDKDAGSPIGALINLRTCQVIPLPDLKGNLLSWVP